MFPSSYSLPGVRDIHGHNRKCKGSVLKVQKKGNVTLLVLITEGLSEKVKFKLKIE